MKIRRLGGIAPRWTSCWRFRVADQNGRDGRHSGFSFVMRATLALLFSLNMTQSAAYAVAYSFFYPGGPVTIYDFPAAGAQLSVTANGLGAGIVASAAVYTQFSLTESTRITVAFSPPASSGLGAITLIDDELYFSGTYATIWTPNNTLALAPMIGLSAAVLQGNWVLTVTGKEDFGVGVPIGSAITFGAELDIVNCGDGSVEQPGEQCDDGNTVDGDCCSSICRYEASGAVCGPAAGSCDLEDTCNGSGTCVDNGFVIAAECRPAVEACDVAEVCDGLGPECPADGFATAGTECRPEAGACDVAETCTGVSGACPEDVFQSGNECRSASGPCDVAESCDGNGADCPADALAPPGTSCELDSSICTIDQCDGDGNCGSVESLDCDDGRLCTLDSCDPVLGCESVSAPVVPCSNETFSKAVLILKPDSSTGEKSKSIFKLIRGDIALLELGDPTATTDYAVCVYDDAGAVAEMSIAGSAQCSGGTEECWSFTGPEGAETGLRMKDKNKPATHDGLAVIKAKVGSSGKGKLLAKAKGANVPELDLAITGDVVAQVLNGEGACFGVTFSASTDFKKNDGSQFKGIFNGP